jgi:hypothetical protein
MPAPATATLSALVTASPFAGTPAAGAQFTTNDGRLGTHFCTASVAQPGSDTPIEHVTGAERLGIDEPAAGVTRVIGYPDAQAQPIICQNRTSMFSATQTQFDCGGFTEGTSGSPLLIDPGGPGGGVTVTGVIGGYEQGGDTPAISYAATFGPNVQALYDVATAQG